MAKKLMIVTAFRKKFQIFLFHLKAALFKPFHYLYGIFIPKCYSYFEILPIFLLHYSYTKTAFSTSYSTTLTIFVRSL